jgi:hypothetical protein
MGLSQVSKQVSVLFPLTKFSKVFFLMSVNFQGFFDEFFVVKSRLSLSKLLVEFNDAFKSGLGSKIHTTFSEILARFWDLFFDFFQSVTT